MTASGLTVFSTINLSIFLSHLNLKVVFLYPFFFFFLLWQGEYPCTQTDTHTGTRALSVLTAVCVGERDGYIMYLLAVSFVLKENY